MNSKAIDTLGLQTQHNNGDMQEEEQKEEGEKEGNKKEQGGEIPGDLMFDFDNVPSAHQPREQKSIRGDQSVNYSHMYRDKHNTGESYNHFKKMTTIWQYLNFKGNVPVYTYRKLICRYYDDGCKYS